MIKTNTNITVGDKLREKMLASQDLQILCKNNKISIEKYCASVAYLYQTDANIQACEHNTIMASVIKLAQIGLIPDANGYVFLTAYNKKCTITVSTKGLIALIKTNNPKVADIKTYTVSMAEFRAGKLLIKEGATRQFFYEPNLLEAKRALKPNEIAGFLAIVYYKDGGCDYDFMPTADVEYVRDNCSAQYQYKKKQGKEKETIWYKHFNEMGEKTALRHLTKKCDFSGLEKYNEIDNDLPDDDKLTADNAAPKKESIAEIKKRKALEDIKKEKEQKEQKIKEAEQVEVEEKPTEGQWLKKNKAYVDGQSNNLDWLRTAILTYQNIKIEEGKFTDKDKEAMIAYVNSKITEAEKKEAEKNEKEGMF